jgi:hypothetical protein
MTLKLKLKLAETMYILHLSAIVDYAAVSTTISFLATTSANSLECINITANTDTAIEDPESFLITISSDDPSVLTTEEDSTIGTSFSTVAILDDTGMGVADAK